jgi:hypothetical protein
LRWDEFSYAATTTTIHVLLLLLLGGCAFSALVEESNEVYIYIYIYTLSKHKVDFFYDHYFLEFLYVEIIHH